MEHSKYGDDFNVGDVYTTAAITVTETHVVNWAGLTMDFYPLHIDKEYAAGTQFGQRLVHGPMIFGIAVGLVSKEGFAGDAAVFIDDTVRVVVEVLDQQQTSKPDKGIQVWRYTVKNQREEDVMVFDYKMMFHMRV